MDNVIILREQEILGKQFRVYGTIDEPLFVANDVADWIEHSNVTEMLKSVDDDEKLTSTIFRSGQNRQVNMLTENGLYEVLMLSRKPIAKKFKTEVKKILRSIRKTGGYQVPATTSGQIQLLAQGYTEMNERIENVEGKVYSLENDMPLYGCEIEEVSKHVKRRVVNVLGGKDSEAYKDSSVRGQVFSDIYTQIKREYGLVSSYKSIKRKYLADVHDFIDCYELPRYLEEQINECNAQMRIGGM